MAGMSAGKASPWGPPCEGARSTNRQALLRGPSRNIDGQPMTSLTEGDRVAVAPSAHVARFGATEWSRADYLAALEQALRKKTRQGRWELEGGAVARR